MIYQELSHHEYLELCCTPYATGKLPIEMLMAVEQGDIETLKRYIESDQDVNASIEGETLLSKACSVGLVDIVELILRRPDVHLNIRLEGYSALDKALTCGQTECARMILLASVKCRPEIKNGWTAIAELLKDGRSLNHRSVIHILNWATYETQWKAAKIILKSEYYIPDRNIHLLIIQALHLNEWDILRKIFGRTFHRREDYLAEALAVTVKKRRWDKVQEFFDIMEAGLRMEIPLVEAALEGDEQEVKRLLSVFVYDLKILNGCLLVISAGGSSESVVKLLLEISNTYTRRTFSDSLYLAVRGQQTELFLHLLSNPEASYSLHDLSRARNVLDEQLRQDELFLFETLAYYLDRLIEERLPDKSII